MFFPMIQIKYNEKICVRCAACASESENGGIKFERGKIIIDDTKIEDWYSIAAICPVGALNLSNKKTPANDSRNF